MAWRLDYGKIHSVLTGHARRQLYGTDEPATTASEVTIRPCDRHPLSDWFPLGGLPTACLIRQHHRTRFGADNNTASGLVPKRP